MPELFVQLDVNWPDHPKVIEAGLDGAALHGFALCLAKRMETDGVLHRAQLARYGATPELIDRLIDVGLFDAVDDRRIRVHGWLERNLSSEAIRTDRDGRRDASRRANHKRWGHRGPVETCPRCNPPATPDGPSDPSPNGTNPQVDPTTDTGPAPLESATESGRTPSESESASLREIERGREIEREAAAHVSRAELSPNPTTPAAAAPDKPDPTSSLGNPNYRQQLINQAAHILAERRATHRPDVGPGWIRATAKGIAKDHHQTAHTYLANHPPTEPPPTAEQVADYLEPPRTDTTPGTPRTPLDKTQKAMLARAQAGSQHTRDILAQPFDQHAALDGIAAARQRLGPPTTDDQEQPA